MTAVLLKGENWIKRHSGRMSCEDEGRDLHVREHQRTTDKPPEAGREAWNRFFLVDLRRNSL